MPISPRIGPFTTAIIADELDELLRAESSDAASARITGKYSGRAPAITAFTATCSTVNCHAARNSTGCKWPTISSRAWLVPASIASTRSRVGNVIGNLSVQLLSRNSFWRLSSVSGPITPATDASMAGMSTVQRQCQCLDHLLHHRTAGQRIVAADIGGKLLCGLAHHRLRHERARRFRQAGHLGDRSDHLVELVGMQRDSRYAISGFQRDGVRGDGGSAITAMANADDRGVAVSLDLFPGLRIVFLISRRQRYDLCFHARQVRGKPGGDRIQELDPVV